MTDSKSDSKSRNMSKTYRFDVSVHTGPLSSQEDVCESFKGILRAADARTKINGLENCSFSYNVPDEGLAKISGYIHVNKASKISGYIPVNKASRLSESAVRTRILDDRISGEIE